MEWTPIFQSIAAEFTQGDNWQLQFDNSIVSDQLKRGWVQYIRKTSARFSCSRCRRTWPSNKVLVLFHMHLNRNTHQGTVKVRIYRQNCKKCANAPMEKPTIDPENIEILMENLVKNMRKKIYHEDFGDRYRRPKSVPVRSPHEPHHCEGCQNGVCDRNADVCDLLEMLNI